MISLFNDPFTREKVFVVVIVIKHLHSATQFFRGALEHEHLQCNDDDVNTTTISPASATTAINNNNNDDDNNNNRRVGWDMAVPDVVNCFQTLFFLSLE